MSRTGALMTVTAGALATVLGVGVLGAPVGTTAALWQSRVTLPGITVEAGAEDSGPIVIEPEEPLDAIELVPGVNRLFYYNVTLDLSQHTLPLVLSLEHHWASSTGTVNNFQGNQNQYWITSPADPSAHPFAQQMYGPTSTARTWHSFYRQGTSPPPGGFADTAVPVGTTEITLRIQVHAVNYDYNSPANFTLSGGQLVAAFHPGSSTAPAVYTVTADLPDLYWRTPGQVADTLGRPSLPAAVPVPEPEEVQEPDLDGDLVEAPETETDAAPEQDVAEEPEAPEPEVTEPEVTEPAPAPEPEIADPAAPEPDEDEVTDEQAEAGPESTQDASDDVATRDEESEELS